MAHTSSAWLAAIALPILLPAQQDGPPTFVPKAEAMVAIEADDIPALLQQFPNTAVGRLYADPEVTTAFGTGLARYRQLAAANDALYAAAEAAGLMHAGHLHRKVFRWLDPHDLQRAALMALLPGEGQVVPNTVALIAPVPKASGRLSRLFDEYAKSLARCPELVPVPEGKVLGFAGHVFTNKVEDTPDRFPRFESQGFWLVNLPGLFAGGEGLPEHSGAIGPAPKSTGPHISLAMNLKAYVEMFAGMGGGMPASFKALGFDELERLQWRVSFLGERILDEIAVDVGETPAGLVGALLRGNATPPAQPLPTGAIAQLRVAIDLPLLLDSLKTLSDGELALPEEIQKDLLATCDGGLAIGIAAPAPGGVVPRLFLSLRIADDKALDRLLGKLTQSGLQAKENTYEGVPCTVLRADGMPAALQPTFCRIDGMLHVAESGLSMRALMKALKAGSEGIDVAGVPLPEGPGEILPNLELRCDDAALYRAFREVWLPLYAATASDPTHRPLLVAADMPEAAVVTPLLGRSRGVLRRDGRRWVLQQVGPLGGVALAALAMTWGPIVSGSFHYDYETEQIAKQIAKQKLETIAEAIAACQKDKGKRPATLGELFVAAKLADDALLVPGDVLAEEFALPGDDGRKVRSSFRYFPDAVTIDLNGNETKVVLIAIAPCSWGRPVLTADGDMPEAWGEFCKKPIGEFGK